MATGTYGGSEFGTRIWVEVRSPKDSEPFLKLKKDLGKNEEGKRVTKELPKKDWVEGHIWDMKVVEGEWEKRKIKNVVISLVDGNTIYEVSIGMSYLGRAMISRLLSIPPDQFAGLLRLGVYRADPEEGYDKGISSPSVKLDGEVMKFKIKPSEYNKLITEVEGDDGTIKQFKKANQYILNEFSTDILIPWEKKREEVRLVVDARTSDLDSSSDDIPDEIVEEHGNAPSDQKEEEDDLPF